MICIARTHADVAHVARLDHIVQCLHRLLYRRVIVEAMTCKYTSVQKGSHHNRSMHTLVQVNIVELQSLQTGFDGVEYVLATQTPLINVPSLIRVNAAGNKVRAGVLWARLI